MIKSLQVSRGLAAVAVVFFHTWLIIFEYSGIRIFEPVAVYGFLGVNYFFILSGFIIMMAHQRDISKPDRTVHYLNRRFTRVYPVYWIYLCLYIAAAAAGLGKPDFSWAPGDMLQSFALFYVGPAAAPPPLNVAWTLFYEIRFYLIFVLLILDKRLGIAALAVWAAAILILPHQHGYLNYVQSYWNINFLLGMGAYLISQRAPPRYWYVSLGIGAAVLLAVFTHIDVLTIKGENGIYILPIGFGFAALVLGFVMLEKHKVRAVPAPFMFLGDASYSIYLVHSGVISVGAIVAKKLGLFGNLPNPILFAAIFIPAVVAGCVAFVAVERPLTTFIRERGKSKGAAPKPTTIEIVSQSTEPEKPSAT